MGRLDDGSAQTLARHVADIEVAVDLHPSPTLALGKDSDGLAFEGLGFQVGVGARFTPQRKRRRHNLAWLARHVALGLDQASEPRIGEIRAVSVAPRIGKLSVAHDCPSS